MPYQDGTGPFGDGRLGRGLGPCGRGDGAGMGARGGRVGRGARCGGFRRRAYPMMGASAPVGDVYPYSKDELKAQKAELEKQLDWLNKEIEKN